MKIAVNTRLLLRNRLEGIGWFSYEILRRITRNHPEHEFLFIFDRPFDPEFIFGDNVEGIVIGPQARHPILFFIWFEISIPRLLKKHKVDLFFSPEHYIPLRLNVPSIQTIHDLSFEHYPKDLPFAAQKYNQIMIPMAAKKARQIFSVSEYSKNDIANLYDISSHKIVVIYNAAKEDFGPSTAEQIQETRNKYNNGKPYYLYVGALNPRKNLVNLFKAFDLVCDKKGNEHKLIVVGNKMYWTKEIEQTYNNMVFKEDVIFLGHLDTANLNQIYGAALALTYVPYFEGFGIPIVEAFRSHCPVITSNVSSMPEVAGDAALLVNPFEADDIARAMVQIADSDKLRHRLIEKGKQQLKRFNWDSSAQKLWKHLLQTNKLE